MSKPTTRLGRIAILWRGDEAARRSTAPETRRFKAISAALSEIGVDAEPVVYEDDICDAVGARLAAFDGVLVWVNPQAALHALKLLHPLIEEPPEQGPKLTLGDCTEMMDKPVRPAPARPSHSRTERRRETERRSRPQYTGCRPARPACSQARASS
jgi:hypothetical protein